jgi:isoquinoline 1-oxidoreductase subunit beta
MSRQEQIRTHTQAQAQVPMQTQTQTQTQTETLLLTRVSRRDFLCIAGAGAAGALVLGVRAADARAGRLDPSARAGAGGASEEANGAAAFAPNMWLAMAADGAVTIWLAKAEMGQGVHTALPMLVADELDAEWSRVRIAQAIVEPKFAEFIGTGGSSSVRSSWEPLRRAGAAAREMLVSAAAARWSVPVDECRTEPGLVIHTPSGRRAAYASVVDAASRLPVPANPRLKQPSQFRLIGTRVPRLDTPAKVNGTAVYGIDIRVPGMLFAVIARCPVYGGTLRSFDPASAKAIAGVRHVIPIGDLGVAIVADNTWAALEARRALQVTWNEGPNAQLTSAAIGKILDEHTTAAAASASASAGAPPMKPGAAGSPAITATAVPDRDDGDVSNALRTSDRQITATYTVPFVAHAAIEPVNCTAHVRADRCDIWGPLQYPDSVQQRAAEITGLPLASIIVHTTLLGGGFGRKAESYDFAAEAVLVSKAIGGQPVQLLWSREDDIAHDHFRPASRHIMTAGFDRAGRLVAWHHRIVAPSLRKQWEWGQKEEDIKRGLDNWATEAPKHVAYRAPNFRVDYVMAQTPVPVGAWRSVYASQTAFADECFVDELAVILRKDPYQFRLDLLGDASPLHRAVLERAARAANWGDPLPPGRARGLALYKYGGNATYVAQVAEVSVDARAQVHVHRVVCAVDCGIVVNPDIVEAQMEGSILYGLSATLMGEITFDRGRCQQSNFHDAPLLRFADAPAIEVHILPSDRPPMGVGEPGVPPIAPAVANAVSAALGRRVRELPLTPARISPEMRAGR